MHIFTATFLGALERQDAEFAQAIRKWAPKLQNVIMSVCNTSGQNPEDATQALLEALTAAATEHRKFQVRHITDDGTVQIWDVLAVKDEFWHCQRDGKATTFHVSDLQQIDKVSFTTFLYTRMIQHVADVYARHFKRTRGFVKSASAEMIFSRAARGLVPKKYSYTQVVFEAPARVIGSDDGGEMTELDLVAAPEHHRPDRVVEMAEMLEGLYANMGAEQFASICEMIGVSASEEDAVSAAYEEATQESRVRKHLTNEQLRKRVAVLLSDAVEPSMFVPVQKSVSLVAKAFS